jgi:ATP-dependent DNA helicase DinG
MPSPAVAALRRVVGRKAGGQARAGQEAMCAAVEAALAGHGHLLVEAPTGTGKSLAYLVPAVLFATSGPERRKVVIVTATKALQEQLVGEDLPFVAEAMGEEGVRFSFAMLKGRSNYLCRAKLDVSLTEGVEARLDFGSGGPQAAVVAVGALGRWADQTDTGDRAELAQGVTDAVWSQVSVDPGECPGAAHCVRGEQCFAEWARDRAASVDIVVVNSHLYATHLAAGRTVLPEHHAVVFDEAHTLEAIVSDVFGLRLSGGRVRRLASRLRGAAAGAGGDLARRLERAGDVLESVLDEAGSGEPTRLQPTEGDVAQALTALAPLVAEAVGELRRSAPSDDVSRSKVTQAVRFADSLAGDVIRLLDPTLYENHVAWVESNRGRSELRLATVDVGPLLAAGLYPSATAVATSATLATGGRFDLLARRLGLTLAPPPRQESERESESESPRESEQPSGPPPFETLTVPSPFDHRRQAFLYVPMHLPDPRHEGFTAAMHEELHNLITAAGGRTLALFTSRAAMERAAEALSGRGGYEVLVQDRLGRAELLSRFRAGPGSALLATQSFWSGIDLPGSLCHLVTIDRIPFPRPTDPLAQARREAAAARGANPFATVDLPTAATLLAQGAGRLIRSSTDEGVVAVFDRRLATARYRPTLLATLPPFRRTIDRAAVLAALQRMATASRR